MSCIEFVVIFLATMWTYVGAEFVIQVNFNGGIYLEAQIKFLKRPSVYSVSMFPDEEKPHSYILMWGKNLLVNLAIHTRFIQTHRCRDICA